MPRASSSSDGTPGQPAGTRTRNTGCGVNCTPSKAPEMAAFSIARVYFSFIRSPTPNGPPTHPVFTSQQGVFRDRSFSPSMDAYTFGCRGKNGEAKQVLKVASG